MMDIKKQSKNLESIAERGKSRKRETVKIVKGK